MISKSGYLIESGAEEYADSPSPQEGELGFAQELEKLSLESFAGSNDTP